MRSYLLLAAIVILASPDWCQAEEDDGVKTIEVWRCYKSSDSKKKTLVTAIRYKHTSYDWESGEIWVAGTKQESLFSVVGFNRRWDFGDWKYAFIIKPDGYGSYYDLSRLEDGETTAPSQTYKCEVS